MVIVWTASLVDSLCMLGRLLCGSAKPRLRHAAALDLMPAMHPPHPSARLAD